MASAAVTGATGRRLILPVRRLRSCYRFASASAAATLPIEVPKKVERNATDVLKALAATVNLDGTAASYSFVDDPYLIPGTERTRVEFALSKEGGRKTAVWLAKHWPTLFMHDDDEPRRDVFRPQLAQERFDPRSMPATEEQLVKFIANRRVLAAWDLFQHLSEADTAVSSRVKTDLFTLLSFYNSTDPVEYFPEAKWLRKFFDMPPSTPAKWNVGGPVDLMWELLTEEEKTPEIYAARICALAKFAEMKRSEDARAVMKNRRRNAATKSDSVQEDTEEPEHAVAANLYDLYVEMKEKFPDRMSEHPEVFEWVMAAHGAQLPLGERVPFVKSLLTEIAAAGIMPTVATFNAAASGTGTLHRGGGGAALRDITLFRRQLLSEMVQLGLQPSLKVYACLLSSVPAEANVTLATIDAILLDLEGRNTLEPTCEEDGELFAFMLRRCEVVLRSDPEPETTQDLKRTVLRVRKLLYSGRNAGFLVDHVAEVTFLNAYFTVLPRLGDVDLLMEELSEFAPNRYDPPSWFLIAALEAVEFSAQYQQLPKLWELTRVTLKQTPYVTSSFLSILSHMPEPLLTEDAELRESLVPVLEQLMKRKLEFTPPATAKDVLTGVHVASLLEQKGLAVDYIKWMRPGGAGPSVHFDLLPKDLEFFNTLVKSLDAKGMKQAAHMLKRLADENLAVEQRK